MAKKKRKPAHRKGRGTYQYRHQNGLLKRQNDTVAVYRQAEKDTTIQYMVDMFCIALNDPAVMGKDTFGAKRLSKVILAVAANYDHYVGALVKGEEATYMQEVLDRRLRLIFRDKLEPFSVRYDWIDEQDI